MLIISEMLLLVIMLCVGVGCAAMDIQKGIVPNKWVMSAGCLALGIQLVYCACLSRAYFITWLVNMTLADLFALLLYAAGIWAAGDVKLFMAMYACVPSRLLDGGGFAFSIIPYLYIFMPAMAWVAIDTLWHTLRRTERFASGQFNVSQIGRMLLVMVEITSVQAFVDWLFPAFIEQNALLMAVLMLIYAYFCSESAFMQRTAVMGTHILVLAGAVFCGGWRWQFGSWGVFALVLLLMTFRKWASGYNYRRIPTQQIRAGMILSSTSALALRGSRVQGLPENTNESMTARLTQQQADALHRWGKTAKGKPTIVIVRKIPFAILISVGFFVWMIVRIAG